MLIGENFLFILCRNSVGCFRRILSICITFIQSEFFFRVSMNKNAKQSIMQIRTGLTQFGYRLRSYSGGSLKVEKLAQGFFIIHRDLFIVSLHVLSRY